MKIFDSIKIQLQLKRYTFDELETLKMFVDKEYSKRKKNMFENSRKVRK